MPFAASDRNCSFAAKTRKLSYATNFTKPHGIQQNRMAGYPKIMCHLHGRLYPLFRPVQCISRGKVESGIQSLGQHLRFISPALRTPVRHDNGNASAARKNVVRKILQKRLLRIAVPFVVWSVLYNLFPWVTGLLGMSPTVIPDVFAYAPADASQSLADAMKNIAMIPLQFNVYTVPMWYLYMLIGLYLYIPFFSLWVERATRKQKSFSWDFGALRFSCRMPIPSFHRNSSAPAHGILSGHSIILPDSTAICC